MLRFFQIPGYKNPVALEINDARKQAYELCENLKLLPVAHEDLHAAALKGGIVKRLDIFTINISNVTFAVYGDELPDITVQALEVDMAWHGCDLAIPPESNWGWERIAAKAALLAWAANQRRIGKLGVGNHQQKKLN